MDLEECVGEGGVGGTLLPPLRAGWKEGTEGLRCRCRAASGSSAPLAAASLGCRARSSELDSDSSGVLGRAPPGCASASSCGRPPVHVKSQQAQHLQANTGCAPMWGKHGACRMLSDRNSVHKRHLVRQC